jgi:3-keto-5-aminohexanoate cleavage enzyme
MSKSLSFFTSEKIMVMSAPNGARRSQSDHPALPVSSEELAENAVALRNAGVSVLHLHVRDDRGGHSLDVDRYRHAIDAIRARVGDDLILQVTTEAVGLYSTSEQMAIVRKLKPEAVSLALREICPDPRDEKAAVEFFEWMHDEQIWPQYIVYSVGELERFDAMRHRGVFGSDMPFVMLVLGNYADGRAGEVSDLDAMLDRVDGTAFPWSVCCFGPNENAVMLAAEARGGHVRIGFENNIVMADGGIARDNAALVRQFTAESNALVRSLANAAEVRAAFSLPRSSRTS